MEEKELLKLIEEKKYAEIQKTLSKLNEVDIAELLNPLNPAFTLFVFRLLPKDLAVEVFANFSMEQQIETLNAISDQEFKTIINELFFDDMIDLIEEMPANIVRKILQSANDDVRALINQFLKYPEDSAGSLMTIEYVRLRKGMSVKEALQHIKKIGLNKETIYTCYITDDKRTLKGFISLRTLVTADEDLLIEDIKEEEMIFVNTHDDQEQVANMFKKYGFLALPVVDSENKLAGIITIDDIMHVIEQEATEDFQKMAAMSPSEEAYLSTGVFSLAKNRLPWLLVLMVSATFTGRIMGHFEGLLTSMAMLAVFIPMLMDTGGNSGNQSSTLIIRGLATGEIKLNDWWKVLLKELRISFLVGISLASINFLRIFLIENIDAKVSFVVSFTIVVTVMASKIVGGVLPLIAKKLKLDPAIMAGPLITTIVDALALMVYFGIAQAFLNFPVAPVAG